MGHEVSITENIDGKWMNIPSVYEGKAVSNNSAIELYKEGKLKALPDRNGKTSWDKVDDAVTAAKSRSEATDPHTHKTEYAEGGEVKGRGDYSRSKLYPSEDTFFKSNPHVAGMAAEDNKVILNPYSKNSPKEQESVFTNEVSRIIMRSLKEKPEFSITDEQRGFFKGTPYETNEGAMRETLVGRILSGDPSAKGVTEDQMNYSNRVRKLMPKTNNYADGGMIDPVSGNEVPPGAFPEEVRDDIPINVSEGEFIFPANAVRFFGIGKLEGMIQTANKKLDEMSTGGRMGGEAPQELGNNFAEGGAVDGENRAFTERTQLKQFHNPNTGRSLLVTFIDNKPIFTIPQGFIEGANVTPDADEDEVTVENSSGVPTAVAAANNNVPSGRVPFLFPQGEGDGFDGGSPAPEGLNLQAAYNPSYNLGQDDLGPSGETYEGRSVGTGGPQYSGLDDPDYDEDLDAVAQDFRDNADDIGSIGNVVAAGLSATGVGAPVAGAASLGFNAAQNAQKAKANEIEGIQGPIGRLPDGTSIIGPSYRGVVEPNSIEMGPKNITPPDPADNLIDVTKGQIKDTVNNAVDKVTSLPGKAFSKLGSLFRDEEEKVKEPTYLERELDRVVDPIANISAAKINQKNTDAQVREAQAAEAAESQSRYDSAQSIRDNIDSWDSWGGGGDSGGNYSGSEATGDAGNDTGTRGNYDKGGFITRKVNKSKYKKRKGLASPRG